ncbi:DUF221-domain-containing protein [Xylaria sp. CBS 124048]|nr:DUF221-domain-containing protein [Xylaria sp. CBS 124048]
MEEEDPNCRGENFLAPGRKDIFVQLVISSSLGFSAFFAFCILRPRWKTLYAARSRHRNHGSILPALPDSFLGWIPALYKVTEEQTLASAGLDAFVFLSFFKMAIRLFSTMLFFSIIVLWPIHRAFDSSSDPTTPNGVAQYMSSPFYDPSEDDLLLATLKEKPIRGFKNWNYLWSYLVFTWFFSLLTVYFVNKETFKLVKVRQDYLGTQSTVTDRTFRLTNIPRELRSEENIKKFVENLEIGHVRNVNLCRDWAEIDDLMAQRKHTLRKLEKAWTTYKAQKSAISRSAAQNSVPNGQHEQQNEHDELLDERARLLDGNSPRDGMGGMGEIERPKIRLRFGFLKMRNRKVDALNYYEEQLRRLDEKIGIAREKEFKPTDTAFVTMDSIAACQMAIQAVVDPRPGHLLTKPAPSPYDVIWRNTYVPRHRRQLQSAIITIFITTLTVLWFFPVALLAQLLSVCNIRRVAPAFADLLERHETTTALVRTGLPTLVVSLLNVLVPYLYDYLSNNQGMISQGDVELSVISKNFFFVFFNIFVVYAVSGSAALADFWQIIRDSLSDTSTIASKIAQSIQSLSNFYLNFIMLQGFGLFPFKLLQFGSVSLYPFYRMGAKTPRDLAGLYEPTFFNYGFYLPTALLIFILCLVYSVLPGSALVLLLGVCYFGLGYFVYKYQLLYSMDQPQHATGGAWPMICRRVILGLISFQVVMLAILVLRKAFSEAALIVPLVIFTLWYNYRFSYQFIPLTRFIALRSIQRGPEPLPQSNLSQDGGLPMSAPRRINTIDEDREKGTSFVNPSLTSPLEQPWIYRDPPPPLSPADAESASGHNRDQVNNPITMMHPHRIESNASSLSLGDTHVWRESGDNNRVL